MDAVIPFAGDLGIGDLGDKCRLTENRVLALERDRRHVRQLLAKVAGHFVRKACSDPAYIDQLVASPRRKQQPRNRAGHLRRWLTSDDYEAVALDALQLYPIAAGTLVENRGRVL